MRVYLNIYQYACVYQYIYMKEITLEEGGEGGKRENRAVHLPPP
jgi:hypothetical protein